MSPLEQTYKASVPLMQRLTEEHQHVLDFCHAMRFVLRYNNAAENQVFITGLEQLISHVEGLRRVASSYHQATGELVRADLHAQDRAREQAPVSEKSL